MVLFASPNDGVISPWQSAWFGVWADNSDSVTVALEDRDIYKQDTIGLRQMKEEGRLHMFTSGLTHLEYQHTKSFVTDQLAQWLVLDY